MENINFEHIDIICPKVTVDSLGYVVNQNGMICEIDLNHHHHVIFTKIINSLGIYNYKEKYSNSEGFEILTKFGYLIYYGPYDRKELMYQQIDCETHGNTTKMTCNHKYIINEKEYKERQLQSVVFLPNGGLSYEQSKFLEELEKSNINENNKVIIKCGHYGNDITYDLDKIIDNAYFIVRKSSNY